jgi:hypothetical protein
MNYNLKIEQNHWFYLLNSNCYFSTWSPWYAIHLRQRSGSFGCRSGRRLLVDCVATPEQSVSLEDCENFFRPDATLRGRVDYSFEGASFVLYGGCGRAFHFSFWIVFMVRAATCGRALSWRNDTDTCALFLLFVMARFTGPWWSAE